jgi:hypothetical protein
MAEVQAYKGDPIRKHQQLKSNWEVKLKKMTQQVDISQFSSSTSTELTQWTLEQTGHSMRDGDFWWVQQLRIQLTKAFAATTGFECPMC